MGARSGIYTPQIARRLQFRLCRSPWAITIGPNESCLSTPMRKVIAERGVSASRPKAPQGLTIGELSKNQLDSLNEQRKKAGFDPLNGLVFFVGKHVHKSRVLGDCYTVEDIIDQIKSAFSEASTAHLSPKMSSLRNPIARGDKYGNQVHDEITLGAMQIIQELNFFPLSQRVTGTNLTALKKRKAPNWRPPFKKTWDGPARLTSFSRRLIRPHPPSGYLYMMPQ